MRGSPTQLFTSESVTEGHPDKACDRIADAVVDAHLVEDPRARVACEVLAKADHVILAGEIRSFARPDHHALVRRTLTAIGYDPDVRITDHLGHQAAEIHQAVDGGADLGAGDQGLMFGYATAETPELMPLPILLAHRLAHSLADDRHAGRIPWLRPDGKTQVTVRYDGLTPVRVEKILVSTQHAADVDQPTITAYVRDQLAPAALADWHHPDLAVQVNPSGSFVEGGPAADCGVTGRKIIVDTYGGAARHGGGAFSGKDPSKVDRSAAYFARYVARAIVRDGRAERAEVQVAYAIGDPRPFSLAVDTFGTGDPAAALELAASFDWKPGAILERLELARPLYEATAAYGHFGRPGFPWEEDA